VSRGLVQTAIFAAYTFLSVMGIVLLRRHLPTLVEDWQAKGAWPSSMWWPVLGAFLYGVSFVVWLVILARTPASQAYPVAVGLTLAGVTLASVIVLREHVTPLHLVGILTIFAGILLVTTAGARA